MIGSTVLQSADTRDEGVQRARRAWDRFADSPISLRNVSLAYVWAALFLVFALWVPDTFLAVDTWKSLAAEQAVTTVLALAVVITLATGVFDLSLAAVLGASAILVSRLMVFDGVAPVPATLITLAGAALVGVVSATVVVVLRVNSFIATLGISSVLAAFTSAVSNNQQIVGLPRSFTEWTTFRVLGLQGAFWIALVIAAIVWFVLEHRPLGRHMFATGGNADAARLAGVHTNRVIFGAMVCATLVAGLAGVVVTSRLGTGSPTIGPPYLLPAFASAFLGSTQVRPGRFNVLGTLIAIYALATGVKGLQLAGAPYWLPELVNGAALLLAVAISVHRRRAILAVKPQARAAGAPVPVTLRQTARDGVHSLRDRTGETVSLIVLDGDGGGKVVDVAESPALLRASARLGETIGPPELEWLRELDTVDGELPVRILEHDGVFEARAPIINGAGPVGLLSVRAPIARAAAEHRREIESGTRETAAAVAALTALPNDGGHGPTHTNQAATRRSQ